MLGPLAPGTDRMGPGGSSIPPGPVRDETSGSPAVAEFFGSIRSQVEARLTTFFDDTLAQTNGLTTEVTPVIAQIRALTMRGGKRLRPALVVAAMECLMRWEDLREAALDVGAAVELLQTYLLIHDDWMDQDTVRRGGPSVHAALTVELGDRGRGEAAAILAGDLASALAQSLLCGPPIPAARVQPLMQAYARLQREVMLGQTLDLLSCTRLEEMYDLKTGSYTTRGPFALGHALAGGGEEEWRVLLAYSTPLGIAFQLRDDLLGTFGDTQETGKDALSDLKAGKRTAPVLITLARLEAAERDVFLSLLGAQDGAKAVAARAMMESAGAVEAVEAQIAAYRDRALTALSGATLRASGKHLLVQLAHELTSRSK